MFLLNLAKGFFYIWKSMNARKKQVEQKKDKSDSPEESRALKLLLETCASYRSQKIFCQEELRFLPDTLTLVARIMSIY